MKTKELHYYYPTSPGAKGWPKGCWAIEVDGEPLKRFTTGSEAVVFADTHRHPWQEAGLACRCVDPETGKTGDWLFVGPDHRTPGTRISPLFPELSELCEWAKRDGWAVVPGTLCQRWRPNL